MRSLLTKKVSVNRLSKGLLYFFFFSLIIALPSVSSALSLTKTPVAGVDTTSLFDVWNVQFNDDTRDQYPSPTSAYNEAKYQEYLFDYSLCSSAQITSVTVTINWKVSKTPFAKIEVYDHTGAYVDYPLSASASQNNEVTDTITVTNITTWEDVNKLKVRFLAYGGTTPAVDYVEVSVQYTDSGICIYPENFRFVAGSTTQTVTASYAHVISSGAGTVDLTATSAHGWATRIYADADMNGIKDDNNPITSLTFTGDEYKGIVVEVDIPANNPAFVGSDVTTVTATRASDSSSSSTIDTTVTPADGILEAEYFEPYANRKFFNYGPNPNMASGELLTYVKDDMLHIYYAQNPRNINDNTYGTWTQCGWGTCPAGTGGHDLYDLVESDHTEFIFYDENGNIKLNFFSDYVGYVTPSAEYPGGYHSCGFQVETACTEYDGFMVINNTALSDTELAQLISIESSAAYNINHYTSGGSAIVNCGGAYGNVDLEVNSPPINRTTYELLCPAAADYQFDYAIELVLPIAKLFPNEPVINVVARAHNSPSKNVERDNPPESAIASVGDYVWYDLNSNGLQDSGEPGIPNVLVELYWDKNGDGIFSAGEKILETRTDGDGYYLFDGIYGGHYWSTREGMEIYSGDYRVFVDEATIPPGFSLSLTPNPYVLSDTIAGATRGTLGYDEDCRTADFGYKPDGGVIGDLVWFDADQDGIQDNGELGLSGVTLDLINVATSQIIATTQTNSQGRYFFTGLSAGTYSVDVTDTGGVLAGYTHTLGTESMPDPTPNIVLGVNGVYLEADFGYWTATPCALGLGDIDGKVYFDQNWNRLFDGTDVGLSNVDISVWEDSNNNELLDAGDIFLGGTTTNSSGDYHFYGLPVSAGGITYILQVTSPIQGLDKFYPGGGLIATLTSSACSSTQNFPYVGAGVIGDVVWSDLDNDGIQDEGELGIEGVTVQAQACTTLSGACTAEFTYAATTDSQGRYMFSGLRTTKGDGTGTRYRITVTDTGNVLNGWNASPQLQGGDAAKDSNNPAGTDVILGGGNPFGDLTIDFGYNNPVQVFGSIGDFIWLDEFGDSLQNDTGCDTREVNPNTPNCGFNNVTVELRDQNGNTIATTTTAGDGAYLFQGLPVSSSGIQYQIVATDLNEVLVGHVMSTNASVLNVTLTDSQCDVIPSPCNNRDADAGYFFQATRVRLSAFNAYDDEGRMVVEWETSSEVNTLGFYLARLDKASGKYERVNRELVPALIGSPRGGIYRLLDAGAQPGETYYYKLIEVENRGARITYGPYEVKAGGKSLDPSLELAAASFGKKPHGISIEKEARLRAARATSESAKLKRETARGGTIKISVDEDGLYTLSAAEISSLLGTGVLKIKNMIKDNLLALSNMGVEVPYTPARGGSGIFFYAQGTESVYTKENIYWLHQRKGLRMEYVTDARTVDTALNETFTEIIHFEEDKVEAPNLFADPEADYWFWEYLFSIYPSSDSRTFALNVKGIANTTSSATLTVRLKGASRMENGPDHHFLVSLNGTVIGEDRFEGTDSRELVIPFSQALLVEGENTVTVTSMVDELVGFSLFLIDSFDLTYERLYKAVNDTLRCRGDGNSVVKVQGFTNRDIFVFDISSPKRAKRVASTMIGGTAGNYSVSFRPSSSQALYLAVSSAAVRSVLGARADVPSILKSTGNGADYLIITSGGLADAAEQLAAYRNTGGLETMVVDLEDIFDEFSYGVYNPGAIRGFLSHAFRRWRKAPGYVVLAGEGNYDYRNIYGLGDNLVPTMMVATPQGLFPSDNYFADVDGDYIPDIAIGRLPVLTADELSKMVGKIARYEGTAADGWEKKIVMLADRPDPEAGDFPSDSDNVASALPPGYIVEKIYRSQLSLSQARQELFDQLNSGALLLNYIGHGSVDRLSNEGLLISDDASSFVNGNKMPVVTAMTCFMNNFGYPGSDTLGEILTMKENGGAIAVWGPTGLSLNSEAVAIDRTLFQKIFTGGEKVLGAAVRKTFDEYGRRGGLPFMIDIYSLLGDPALRMK